MELDPQFEPLQRARSNTWPLPRPDLQAAAEELNGHEAKPVADADADSGPNAAPKRNSSRRNAWGNMSYADLITQAIQSTPENRLTLSQIYEWMVHNVPYFKDKGDTNSSAGWKNSIRHNLSLHNRFMRVQNEGTGKSSWWMINPDAKPGKAARRRATSMETSKYEKKRGRVKKKVEALRAGLTLTPSPSSSVSESLDVLPESPLLHQQQQHFQLSPADFRPRASSNASSIGGRLSPIPSVNAESELQETQWNPDFSSALYSTGPMESFNTEQLIENITGSMKIGESAFINSSALPTNGFSVGLGLPPVYTTTSSINGYSLPQQTSYCLTDLQSLSPASLDSSSLPAAQMMNQLMGALNNNGPIMPHDLDLNLDALQGHFDCNVDEVIKHELSLDGSLDFNFPASVQQQLQQHHYPQQQQQQHQQQLLGSTNEFLINSTGPSYLATPTSPAICRSWVRLNNL